MPDQLDLGEIKERCEKATLRNVLASCRAWERRVCLLGNETAGDVGDALEHMLTYLPACVAEIERLRKEQRGANCALYDRDETIADQEQTISSLRAHIARLKASRDEEARLVIEHRAECRQLRARVKELEDLQDDAEEWGKDHA